MKIIHRFLASLLPCFLAPLLSCFHAFCFLSLKTRRKRQGRDEQEARKQTMKIIHRFLACFFASLLPCSFTPLLPWPLLFGLKTKRKRWGGTQVGMQDYAGPCVVCMCRVCVCARANICVHARVCGCVRMCGVRACTWVSGAAADICTYIYEWCRHR